MRLRLGTRYLLFCINLSFLTLDGATTLVLQEVGARHFKFERGPSGKTIKNGGIEISFSRFKSEEGILVERFVEDYKTSQAAIAALQAECKHSLRVNHDGFRYGAHGKRIGRRVELLFPRTKNAAEHTEVAWTDGPLLYLLRSESREHLLDFERQAYPTTSTENPPR